MDEEKSAHTGTIVVALSYRREGGGTAHSLLVVRYITGVHELVCNSTCSSLTYAAAVSRVVAMHERPVVDNALSGSTEAAAKISRRVLCAVDGVEYDRACGIPSKHLHDSVQNSGGSGQGFFKPGWTRFLQTWFQLSSSMLTPIAHEESGAAISVHECDTDVENERRVPFRSIIAPSTTLLCFVE